MKREITLYGVFGVLTTVVGIGAYNIFVTMGCHYTLANTGSFILAVLFAYVTNRAWVFQSSTCSPAEMLHEGFLFLQSRVATFLLETAGLWLMIDQLHVGELMSKLVCNGVVIVLNYLLSKFYVFKGEKS